MTGATATASAPADVAGINVADNSTPQLSWGGNLVAELPKTSVDGVGAKTSYGDPVAGTSANPIGATSQGAIDLEFTNRPNLDSALGLNYGYVARQPAGATTEQSRATAWVGSVSGTAHQGSVGLTARTSDVQVLQTSFATEGLVQMRLNTASLSCSSRRNLRRDTPSYSADIRFRTYTPSALDPSIGTYIWQPWIPLAGTQTTDPLASVNLTPGPGGVPVGYNNGRLVYLGEYVQDVSSRTSSTLSSAKVASSDGNKIEYKSTAMVSLSTVPLRDGEDLSSVNVGLGVLSCVAEDNR